MTANNSHICPLLIRWMKSIAICFVFVCPLVAHGANTLTTDLLRADRHERWHEVLAKGKNMRVASHSDVPGALVVLRACVATGCDPETISFRLVDSEEKTLRKFFNAWVDFLQNDPRSARTQFEAMLATENSRWLGVYGLLSYAMEAQNLLLLNRAIELGESSAALPVIVREKLSEARLFRLEIQAKYGEFDELCKALGPHLAEKTRSVAAAYREMWRNDLVAARRIIDTYTKRFGYDHDIAIAELELESVRLAGRKLVSFIAKKLKANPNFWMLDRARVAYIGEADDTRSARPVLSDQYPRSLTVPRLVEMELVTRDTLMAAEQLIADIDKLSSRYGDFQLFRLAAANAYALKGDPDKALEQLDVLDSQTPLSGPSLGARAGIEATRGRYESATKLLRVSLALTPNDVHLKLNLVRALTLAKDYHGALKVLDSIPKGPRYVPTKEIELLKSDIREGLDEPRNKEDFKGSRLEKT